MKIRTNILLVVCCVLVIRIPGLSADNPEQLVAAHLKSIGTSEALSQIKSIGFTGTAHANFIQGMSGQLSGTSMLVSEGSSMGIVMNFQNLNYPAEHFAYDGKNVTVGDIGVGMKSPIADFLNRFNKIMKNGMLGGVFSKAWPLLDIKSNRPNMQLRKSKIDGIEYYEIEYRPRDNHGEMRIRLYFDMETYRHVISEYRVSIRTDVSDLYYTLREKFDDFRVVGDLTLPHGYTLEYSTDGNQSAFIGTWKIEVRDWKINAPDVDRDLFKAGK